MAHAEETPQRSPAPRPGFWQRQLRDGVRGGAEALFPENDLGAPDWRSTEVVDRTLSYIEELPPPTARLVRLLFVALELVFPVLVPDLRPFSRLSVARRTRALDGWRTSSLVPLNQIFDAVRGVLTMQYFSHPSVVAHIREHKACARPEDPLQMEVRPDALDAVTDRDPREAGA